MKTLIVYYSKSGNTRTVAEKVRSALLCDLDEIQFSQKEHIITGSDLWLFGITWMCFGLQENPKCASGSRSQNKAENY